MAHCEALPEASLPASAHSVEADDAGQSRQRSTSSPQEYADPQACFVEAKLSTEPAVLFVASSQCRTSTSGWRGVWNSQSALRCTAGICAAALVCSVLVLGFSNPAPAGRTELIWNPLSMEEDVPEDHDLWGGRDRINRLLRERATEGATRVSMQPQDDDQIGVVLARAAHVAFDTVVEIKRAMRGMRGREADYKFDSKIEVVETMLSHLLEKLGINSVPPPPRSSQQASLTSAIEMARALRLMISNLPSGSDARDYREARYNLAVYDLDQVSRQINEIMLMLRSSLARSSLRASGAAHPFLTRRITMLAARSLSTSGCASLRRRASTSCSTTRRRGWRRRRRRTAQVLLPLLMLAPLPVMFIIVGMVVVVLLLLFVAVSNAELAFMSAALTRRPRMAVALHRTLAVALTCRMAAQRKGTARVGRRQSRRCAAPCARAQLIMCCVLTWAMVLRGSYAMCGTDAGYGVTRLLRNVRY